MKKIALIIMFVTSMFAAGNNIQNLPDAKIISTSDCNGINLHVNFKTDSSVIEEESYIRIKEFSEYMMENSSKSASISGHTDNKGSDIYNKSLSERRAEAVYNKIIDYGVDASRLTHQGYGELNPVATNNTVAGRHSNRRIEAKLH